MRNVLLVFLVQGQAAFVYIVIVADNGGDKDDENDDSGYNCNGDANVD